MKTEVFEASIQKGSTKLVTVADKRYITAPHGSFVKISSNEIIFKINDSETLNLKKSFVTENKNVIKIKGNYDFKITTGDSADIYFDNYYVSQLKKINNGGKRLEVDDILYCTGGVPTIANENLSGKVCELKVTAVDGDGCATNISINEKGAYNTPPTNPVIAVNEKEVEVEVMLEVNTSEETSLSERTFASVDASPTETIITLSYPLPDGVKNGEIILSKQIINLDRPYEGKPCYCEICSIVSDFSPVNSFPLMASNNPSMHTVYNTAIEMLEEKFKKIEDRLQKLEKN